MDKAERELRSELREEVGFERNTVWRDMVAMERRTGAVVMQVRRPGGRGARGCRPCATRTGLVTEAAPPPVRTARLLARIIRPAALPPLHPPPRRRTASPTSPATSPG
jgi:hypothetical protein